MASGDGLILRVKPRGGRLSLGQARAIALVSSSCGNGALDLTGRANLQIRGLTGEGLAEATEILDRAGLLDADAAAEAVRNIVSSPLAGLDHAAAFDIGPAVEALEARLADDTVLHALSAKFGFLVDDGGRFGLADVPADIRFEAFRSDFGPGFAVRLGGADEAAGRCGPEDIADVAAALARVFLFERAGQGELRMRDLVGAQGAGAILRRAGLGLFGSPKRSEPASPSFAEGGPAGRNGASVRAVGRLVQHGNGASNPRQVLGIGAPFGRLSAEQLQIVAEVAGGRGATGLRLTPWRLVLVPGLHPAAATNLANACAAAGLITDPDDARLRVRACTGAPGCLRGSTAILDHAAELASRLGPSRPEAGVVLHVSGCSKGCAHSAKAPLVLVAKDGLYDIVVGGTASDRPTLRGLTFAESVTHLPELARMEART